MWLICLRKCMNKFTTRASDTGAWAGRGTIAGPCGRQSNALPLAWWRHQMETFSALLAICAGNSPVPGEFPTQRPVTRNFDVFFDLRLNKLLSKHSWGWWFETPSRPLWRHRNGPWEGAPLGLISLGQHRVHRLTILTRFMFTKSI